ncbi:MAG: carboxypeptidase regulatory-like domain-containing protein [Gemmatimonadetes bacterium]|nr:carboxypeptidase regulatory-like domain-containing protein [Gemmatimonadota bacterium]
MTSTAGAPLAAVTMRLMPGERQVQSDSTGRFRFDRLTAGRFTLTARRIGYVPWRRDVEARRGGGRARHALPNSRSSWTGCRRCPTCRPSRAAPGNHQRP